MVIFGPFFILLYPIANKACDIVGAKETLGIVLFSIPNLVRIFSGIFGVNI